MFPITSLFHFEDHQSSARHFWDRMYLKVNSYSSLGKKTAIDGKDIEVTGQKKRIQKIVALTVEKGFDIPEKSIKHYAKEKEVEYVLVRFK